MAKDAAKQRARRNKDLFTVTGVSGLMRYGTGGPPGASGASGLVFEEWRRELQLDRGRRIYREMSDEDPIIGALLFAIRMLIRQVDWVVAPANNSATAAAAAALVDSALHDMEISFPDTVCEILSMLIYGFHYAEILYKVRAGPNLDDPTRHSKHTDHKVGWRAWATRSQDSLFQWAYDEDDRLTGMIQLGPPDWQYHFVPLAKSMLFRTDTYKGNPEGRSILRNAYQSYYDVKHIRQIEGIGIERDLAGVPVMGVPPNVMNAATKEDQASLAQAKKIVTNLKRDEQEGVVMPLAYDANGKEVYKLWLLSTGGARQFDTSKIIERYESRIAMTCLADFVLLGHEQTGTYSLGESKLGVFALAIAAWLDTIGAIINDVAIARLCDLNGYDLEDSPRLEHQDIEKADLGALGSFLTVLSQTGLLPKDQQLIRHLFAAAGLPEPEDDVLDAHVDVHQQQQQAQAAQAQANATMAAQTAKDGAPPTAGKTPPGKPQARKEKPRLPKLEASEPSASMDG